MLFKKFSGYGDSKFGELGLWGEGGGGVEGEGIIFIGFDFF